MRKTGSLLALLAGVLALTTLGTVVLVRTVSSPSADAGHTAATRHPSPPPPPSPSIPSTVTATYASRVKDSGTVVAMTVRSGNAIAYVCDGQRVEAWLRGKIYPEGMVRLQGPEGVLTGMVQGTSVIGAASLDEESLFAFRAPAVQAPSGLYRATSTVRGARLVGGWIVLPSGDQVGLLNLGRTPRPAPVLDPAAEAVTVDGVRVPVAPADPARP
jgi:serine/threonine-protein kinase